MKNNLDSYRPDFVIGMATIENGIKVTNYKILSKEKCLTDSTYLFITYLIAWNC
ncbi:hypothetical protein HYE30_03145 [Mycoplasmopsis bovis]|nr:hypothetical protein [Mycoplasmopsis bovis]QQH22596.1 hypothetical protein HYE30_03145 [Mycoplasmopsis bovis]